MADRPTSVAKSVEGLHHEESALDRALVLRNQFALAQNDNQQQKESHQRETESEKPPAGSQMVRADAPVLRPTPSGPMRGIPDRQFSAEKVAREQEAARKVAAQLTQDFKARQGKTHDHDRER